ncbi:hypothetical protein TpMuguga_02g00834 [Theileria parva strain Muguga]|uniref:Uncharacterized protein n=1 Tax=Theileria parva TaxID=5875 RepID=Q4N404_THEPA|nr:uncharacterized protein TpMuguga_02g00834 [Theileria parva strain Muguga]EAN33119.1 hypothetical protein TpMuguga_02g00834 [Theileria parva strain Muguga]|eukprot:XP_765402.1 hypothetical protein [Theileria parva strain Muguga]
MNFPAIFLPLFSIITLSQIISKVNATNPVEGSKELNTEGDISDYKEYLDTFTIKKFLDKNQLLLTENTLFLSFLTQN